MYSVIAVAVASIFVFSNVQTMYGQVDPRIEAAESTIKEGLKDPDSAQFKNVALKTNSVGETAVCGEFNARNSFGGYVGFHTFGVVEKLAVIQDDVIAQAKLARMGCLGADAELSVRHSDAQTKLANKLHDQASFSCNVIWTMMDNRFRQQQDLKSVLDAAIAAFTNRAKENNSEVSPEMLKSIRSQFETQLAKTEGDKKVVASIRKGDVAFKDEFISSCSLQTDQTLRVRAGIQ